MRDDLDDMNYTLSRLRSEVWRQWGSWSSHLSMSSQVDLMMGFVGHEIEIVSRSTALSEVTEQLTRSVYLRGHD